jgi:hypothetical protein
MAPGPFAVELEAEAPIHFLEVVRRSERSRRNSSSSPGTSGLRTRWFPEIVELAVVQAEASGVVELLAQLALVDELREANLARAIHQRIDHGNVAT